MPAYSITLLRRAHFEQRATFAAEAVDAHLHHRYTQILVQRGDATGDISHVVAALATTGNLAVVVVDGATKDGDSTRGYMRIANVYVDQFGLPQDRVAHVDLNGGNVGGNVK